MDEKDHDTISIDMDEYLIIASIHDYLATVNDLMYRLYGKNPEILNRLLFETGEDMSTIFKRL